MEPSERTRKQETRQLLLADCKEQAESAARTLDEVVQALETGDAEIACGAFTPLPEQVRYVGLILQRLVTLTAEIKKGSTSGSRLNPGSRGTPREGSTE